MPKISIKNKEKIQEQLLSFLFHIFPKSLFTSEISSELVRDEEFIKNLLLDLETKKLILRISKSPKGNLYKRRIRWRLTNKAHSIFSQKVKLQDTYIDYNLR